MEFIDTFLGMPWDQFVVAWKASVNLLFTKYLFLTILTYIIFIVVLAVSDVMDVLMQALFYFSCIFLLFAYPISKAFAWTDWFLNACGVQLPKFFS